MSDKLYDILNKIQRWLPAVAAFFVTLCGIYGWTWGDSCSKTIIAVATLLAATLEIANSQYNKKNGGDL